VGLACSFVHANRVDNGHGPGIYYHPIHRRSLFRLPFRSVSFHFYRITGNKELEKRTCRARFVCVYIACARVLRLDMRVRV